MKSIRRLINQNNVARYLNTSKFGQFVENSDLALTIEDVTTDLRDNILSGPFVANLVLSTFYLPSLCYGYFELKRRPRGNYNDYREWLVRRKDNNLKGLYE